MSIWSNLFWKDVVERMLATVAQVLLGIITADGFNVVSFDVTGTLTVVGAAAVGVLLKALIASQVSKTVSPASLAKDERGI